MYDTTWSSYYVGEPTVVRLGTKPRPKPKPKPPPKGDEQRRPPRADDRPLRAAEASPPSASALSDVLGEPGGDAVGRCVAASIVACVVQPVATRSAVALDEVLVAEPRAADLGAAHPDPEHVVEDRGAGVLDVHRGGQRLEPALADRR